MPDPQGAIRVCTKCGVPKDAAEFYLEPRVKSGLSASCKACAGAAARASWERRGKPKTRRAPTGRPRGRPRKDPAEVTNRRRDYNREWQATYRAANRDKLRDYYQRWAKANASNRRDYLLAWHGDHPGYATAAIGKYRAARLQACPVWVDANAVRAIYADCQAISTATGIPHHVDHVIPLQHPLVCGLHVPWNLQVLPAVDNLRKSNSFHQSTHGSST